ncbi:MAG: hypothetical protein KUG57_07455 [Ilumatobacteraceae bacterium]|nr:hypothetical protein [Ilumatobacteraceae bacterium]
MTAQHSSSSGLDGLRDRSSRPHFSPLATHTDVVGKIVYLRQHYHFGPMKISMYLARYHDIKISNSGVWDPRAPRPQPAPRQPTTQDPRPPLETLREASPRTSSTDRRQVHRTRRRRPQKEVLPVHRDR